MIFGDKKNSKRTAQLKSVLEDAVDEALKRQARELARQQEGQNAYLSEGIEKNQKAIRSLADTVEDFLDTLQEADEAGRQSRQVQESAAKREQRLLELVGLQDTGRKKAKNFSLGMRQRLGIAVAMAGAPDFLVLDEPVNGLDPQGIVEMRELILRLNREKNITVLISSHILDELSRLATHYGFIDGGSMLQEISAKELENVCRKYIRVTVSNIKALVQVLDSMGMEYTVRSDTVADIYSIVGITELTLALAQQNCKVEAIQERGETLEDYYINLVGGGNYA